MIKLCLWSLLYLAYRSDYYATLEECKDPFAAIVDNFSSLRLSANFDVCIGKVNEEFGFFSDKLALFQQLKSQYIGSINIFSIFRPFLMELDKLKEHIEAQIENFVKEEIKRMMQVFMQFDDGVDVLTAEPNSYSSLKIDDIEINRVLYRKVLGAIQRFGWIFGARKSGKANQDDRLMIDRFQQTLNSMIDRQIVKIGEDNKVAVKAGKDDAIALFVKIKKRLTQIISELEPSKKADWQKFEPFIRFGLAVGKSLFKKQIEQLITVIKQPIADEESLLDYKNNLNILALIVKMLDYIDLADELKPKAKEIRVKILQEVLDSWLLSKEIHQDFFRKNESHFRLFHQINEDKIFDFLKLNSDSEEFSIIIKRLYDKLEAIRKNIPFKPGKVCSLQRLSRLLSQDLISGFAIKQTKFNNIYFKTYELLICYQSMSVSSSEFKKSVAAWSPSLVIKLLEKLIEIEPEKIDQTIKMAKFLKASRFLSINEELFEHFMVIVSLKLSNLEKTSSTIDSEDFSSLSDFIKNKQFWPFYKPMQNISTFLSLIVLIEDPSKDWSLKIGKLSEGQLAEIKRFLYMKEFSQIPNCLFQVFENPIQVLDATDLKSNPGKLDINMQLAKPDFVGSRLDLSIEFISETEYEIRPFYFDQSQKSTLEFVELLRNSRGISKPENFNLSACYAAEANKIVV